MLSRVHHDTQVHQIQIFLNEQSCRELQETPHLAELLRYRESSIACLPSMALFTATAAAILTPATSQSGLLLLNFLQDVLDA